MGQNWIIDVLADLKSFAQQNDLPLLAVQLDETAFVAAAEIASVTEGTPEMVGGDSVGTRTIFTSAATGRRA